MSKSIPDAFLSAIAGGEPVSFQDIMSLGLDLNAAGVSINRTLLTSAAYAGRSDLIVALVDAGATLDTPSPEGMTALHEAASRGQLAAVQKLLDLGANIEAEEPGGCTPLMLASAWGHRDVVRLLLEWGSDVKHRNRAGFTALMLAEYKDEADVAAMLSASEAGTASRGVSGR